MWEIEVGEDVHLQLLINTGTHSSRRKPTSKSQRNVSDDGCLYFNNFEKSKENYEGEEAQ